MANENTILTNYGYLELAGMPATLKRTIDVNTAQISIVSFDGFVPRPIHAGFVQLQAVGSVCEIRNLAVQPFAIAQVATFGMPCEISRDFAIHADLKQITVSGFICVIRHLRDRTPRTRIYTIQATHLDRVYRIPVSPTRTYRVPKQ